MQTFFATCARGLEYLLVDELQALGAQAVREGLAGVHFEGELETGYRAVLWSRLASRVLLVVKQARLNSTEELYEAVQKVPWLEHLQADASLVVDFSGQNRFINNTQFGAQKVKDAIVDQFRELTGQRPSVDADNPSLRINAHIAREKFTLSLDLSGHALHARGYRAAAGAAPLKENLAAAILIRAGWPAAAAEGKPLLDPVCGAGTLAIEAALMAANIAPGLLREDFGCNQGWLAHDEDLWARLRLEASEKAAQGKQALRSKIFGLDADKMVLDIACANAEQAGVANFIEFKQAALSGLNAPDSELAGVLVANPPYGERLGTAESLVATYAQLGTQIYTHFQGWHAAIITSEPVLAQALALRSHKQYALNNGGLACKLYLFDIAEASRRDPDAIPTKAFDAGAQQLLNRLQKNRKHLAKWLKREQIEAYRIYDADLPE